MTLSQNSKVDLFRALVYLLNTATDFIIALLLLAWKSHTTLQPETTLKTDTTPTKETTLTPETTSKTSQEQDGGCEVKKYYQSTRDFYRWKPCKQKTPFSLHLSLRYIMFGGDHWQSSSYTFQQLWPFLTSTGRFPRQKDTVYSGLAAC